MNAHLEGDSTLGAPPLDLVHISEVEPGSVPDASRECAGERLAPGRVVLIRTLNDLEANASRLRSLELGSTAPMQQLPFIRTCADELVGHRQLRILAVLDDGRCAAAAPLCRGRGVVARLEVVGAYELGEPADLLYRDANAAERLAHALARRREPLLLRRLPRDSAVIPALARAMKGRGACVIKPAGPSPYIELGEQWKTPEAQFNAGRRSDFRRAQRHAAQLGAVSYEVLTPSPAQTPALIEEAIAVEMQSWKGRSGTALGVDELRGNFFRSYARAASERGILRLVFVRIDGKAIGMQIALECHDRFWLFKIGYDEAYAKCSPGTLMMLHTLKYAAERGLTSYELLGTAEPWTQMWTDRQRDHVEVRTYPLSVSGAAAFAIDAVARARGKMRRRPG